MMIANTNVPCEMTRYRAPHDVRRVMLMAKGETHASNVYASGDLALLKRRSVAIIGSRGASVEGRDEAADVARSLAAYGIVVVSGLAAGIDVAAHEGAIQAGGRTVAVIGTPLDRAYPKEHARLQEAIYERHLLVSPFANGTRTYQGHLPVRNCLMARLADATVLVEAGETSGTKHQVREALTLGKPVLVWQRLLRGDGVTWVRELVKRSGVLVWETAQDVVPLLETFREAEFSPTANAIDV